MQSNRRTPRGWTARLGQASLGLWLGLSLVISCGYEKPPQPPPSKIPASPTDLEVQQRGRELLLTMSYPSTTMGGLAISELRGIEVREMKRIVPTFLAEEAGETTPADGQESSPAPQEDDPAQEPESPTSAPPDAAEPEPAGQMPPEAEERPMQSLMFRFPTDEELSGATPEKSKEDLVPVSAAEFEDLSQAIRTVDEPELRSAVSGDRIILRIPLSETPEEEDVAHVFGVRVLSGRRRASALSNLVKIVPRHPPPPPTSIEVTAQETGVRVSWSTIEGMKGYRVYRRDAQSREYGEPIYSPAADLETHLDTGAVFGRRYIYTVTSVSSQRPLVESAITAEYEIDYQDRFPPPVPRGLVALAEGGRVRLLWEPVAATDLAGYRILRRQPGGEPEPIHAEPIIDQEYFDREIASGRSYLYSIEALDRKGNRSQPSDEIEVRVP